MVADWPYIWASVVTEVSIAVALLWLAVKSLTKRYLRALLLSELCPGLCYSSSVTRYRTSGDKWMELARGPVCPCPQPWILLVFLQLCDYIVMQRLAHYPISSSGNCK